MRTASSLAGAFLLIVLSATTALAATWTGGGAGDGFSDPANWGGAVPQPNEDLVFTGTARSNPVNDLPAGTVFASMTFVGTFSLSGQPLAISRLIAAKGGETIIACPLALAGDAALATAADGSLLLSNTIDTAGHQLAGDGEGTVTIRGPLIGDGGVIKRGAGVLVLAAENTYTGATRVENGTLRIGSDVVASAPGACGRSDQPIVLDGGTLQVDAEHLSRPIALGPGGGGIDAFGRARVVDAAITTYQWSGGSILGSYVNASMRAVTQDDWRGRQPITGTRQDPVINFPNAAFGTEPERAAFKIAGDGGNWENFSIQWDGWIDVPEGVTLYTRSDDGSRVWIDLDRDGVVQPAEWGSNAWGQGQGTTLRPVHGPLHAGVYAIRVQYEEGGGGNAMGLLWSDAAHSAGTLDGQFVVPAVAFLRAAFFRIGGDTAANGAGQPLTLTGAITGAGAIRKVGTSELILAGADNYSGATVVDGGTLECAHAHALTTAALTIGEHGTLRLAGHPAELAGIAGAGAIDLGTAMLTVGSDGRSTTFTGPITGTGGVRKVGDGTLTLSNAIAWTGATILDGGSLALGDRRCLCTAVLKAPLATDVTLPPTTATNREIVATITVPADAPVDLGVGAYAADQHGHRYQSYHPRPLVPGRQQIRFSLGEHDVLHSDASTPRWDAAEAAICRRAGLFFWSASASRARITVDVSSIASGAESAKTEPALTDLCLDGGDGARAVGRTGERWQLTCVPTPFPANPYDPDDFALEAVFTAPGGAKFTVPGFLLQPMATGDRGDRELVLPVGGARFAARFRPRVPGSYSVQLVGRWSGGRTVTQALPQLVVTGEPWDDYVRVDAGDPRFFSTPGGFFWGVGLNMRSVNDVRSKACMGTRVTPDRGALSYRGYFDRLAFAGGTVTELWLSAWNLGLEWKADIRGFYGNGRYNQEHAWELDRVLDDAYARHLRINLVIYNHGQGAEGNGDAEWEHSSYNLANGGRLARAGEFFTDPWALAGQERLRRYLIARYADHPAILGWKMWSEVNLTAAGGNVVPWHERALARWHALDIYHHPVTTHWCGDYHNPDRAVVALPGLDYVCIDAYHGGNLVAQLLSDSTLDPAPNQGLSQFGKPLLVTEFGGSAMGTSQESMAAQQSSGLWSGLVSGHASTPLLWWIEWVDQHDRWQCYRGITEFIRGEDLRGKDAHSIALAGASPAGALWARAWQKPERILGYVLDAQWGRNGAPDPMHQGATVTVTIPTLDAGHWTITWWDVERGAAIASTAVDHAGGALILPPPAFQRHIAFKIVK